MSTAPFHEYAGAPAGAQQSQQRREIDAALRSGVDAHDRRVADSLVAGSQERSRAYVECVGR